MENSIKVIDLKKNYGNKEAVKNINFEIKENEIIGLLGTIGCGKTTTIGMILGRLELFAILVLFLPSFWRN